MWSLISLATCIFSVICFGSLQDTFCNFVTQVLPTTTSSLRIKWSWNVCCVWIDAVTKPYFFFFESALSCSRRKYLVTIWFIPWSSCKVNRNHSHDQLKRVWQALKNVPLKAHRNISFTTQNIKSLDRVYRRPCKSPNSVLYWRTMSLRSVDMGRVTLCPINWNNQTNW